MDDRKGMQLRSVQPKFSTRAADDKKYICCYFARFDDAYELWDGASEVIDSHAFDDTLNDDIRCLVDHMTWLILGRTESGTLTLKVDDVGLYGEVLINENDQDAVNLYERVKRGDVNQCSFGFEILSEKFDEGEDYIRWTILKVRLYEVSIVTFPAYENTSATVRKEEFKNMQKRKIDAWKQKTLKVLKGE